MDVQLKELIEKIKSEGIKNAEEKSAEIITAAEKKAAEIITHAEQDAEKIRSSAKQDAEKKERTGREALVQAGRDLLLSIQAQIENLFEALLREETGKAFTPEILEETIVTLVKSWSEKRGSDIQVLLSRKDLDKLEDALKHKLGDKIKEGFEMESSSNVEAGFRVAEKDGSAYYNFTAEGMAELLAEYLNPKLTKIIQDAAKKG
jgi:V/A-type H+-transporting ATPase subunit E